MRAALASALFILMSGIQIAHADDGPLAPAKEGKLWCYEPDSERKTCQSISRFEWDGAGNIHEDDEIAISANPLVIMKLTDAATIENSSICQVMREETFLKAIFLVDGKPASPEQDSMYRKTYGARLAQFHGRKVCVDTSPYESIFITQLSIDGTPYPSATSRLKWISPDEGYVLEPR